eukprot:tig00020610_g11948.t1
MPQDFDSTVQASGVQFQLDEDNTYIFKNKLARLGPELPLLGNPNLTSLNSTADINTQVHKQVEVHPTTQVDESRLDNPDIELNIVPGLESLQLQAGCVLEDLHPGHVLELNQAPVGSALYGSLNAASGNHKSLPGYKELQRLIDLKIFTL